MIDNLLTTFNFADKTAHLRWIAGRIQEILGSDDDVVIELCFGLFEGARYVGTPYLTMTFNAN